MFRLFASGTKVHRCLSLQCRSRNRLNSREICQLAVQVSGLATKSPTTASISRREALFHRCTPLTLVVSIGTFIHISRLNTATSFTARLSWRSTRRSLGGERQRKAQQREREISFEIKLIKLDYFSWERNFFIGF